MPCVAAFGVQGIIKMHNDKKMRKLTKTKISVAHRDPDPGSARIRMNPHSFWSAGSGLGIRIRIQADKMTHKSEENSSFYVLD